MESLEIGSSQQEMISTGNQSEDLSSKETPQSKTILLSKRSQALRWDVVWLFGLFCLFARNGWQHFTLMRIRKDSKAVTDVQAQAFLHETLSKLNITKKVALIETPRLVIPATWGWLRPVIAVPVHARDWSPESLRNVLEHECTHIKRNDFMSLQVGAFVRALTWCNPMSWWFFKRIRTDMEMACDEQVLAAGTQPAHYAQTLLNIARSASDTTLPSAVLMATKPNVQRRIEAVLKKSSLSSSKPFIHWIPLMGLLLLTLLLGSQTTLPQSDQTPTSSLDAADPEFEKRLKNYFQKRYDRTKLYIAEKNLELPEDSEYLRFYQLGINGDWKEALELVRSLEVYNPNGNELSDGKPRKEVEVIQESILRHPFMECHKLLEICEDWNGNQINYFISNTLETLPNKSILIWDERAGGNLLSLYADELAGSKEILAIDQNAIVDTRYCEYLRDTISHRINIPSESDVSSAFITYMSEAASRYHADQLLPGESVTTHPDGRVAIQGSVAVMGVGTHLLEWIESNNGDWTFLMAGSFANPFIQDHLMNVGLLSLYQSRANLSSDHKRVNMRFTKTKVESIFEHLAGIRPEREACREFIQQQFLQPHAAKITTDKVPNETVRNAWANLILSQCKAIQTLSPPITPGELQVMLDPLFLQAWTLCPQNQDVVDSYTGYLKQTDQLDWKDTVSNITHRIHAIKSHQAGEQ